MRQRLRSWVWRLGIRIVWVWGWRDGRRRLWAWYIRANWTWDFFRRSRRFSYPLIATRFRIVLCNSIHSRSSQERVRPAVPIGPQVAKFGQRVASLCLRSNSSSKKCSASYLNFAGVDQALSTASERDYCLWLLLLLLAFRLTWTFRLA